MKILLVDDDEQVLQLITATLSAQNYTVDTATDGLQGWDLLHASPYNLVLLDVMMPRLDGISFCRKLRAEKNQTPIILMTARNTSLDKMSGLDAGADDYLVKPLDLQELMARMRALLRRGEGDHSPVLEWGLLQLNPATLDVRYGEHPLTLRRKEFAILELLLRHKHRVFSRSAILDHLWSLDEAPSEETIKAHIKAIRHQLRLVKAEELIETLYGQGYRLNPAFLNLKPAQPSPAPPPADPIQVTRSAIARIWQQTKGVSFERLAVLELALQALQTHSLEEILRQQAEQNAHKLHGSLGTFGFRPGSDLARQIESAFASTANLEAVGLAQIEQWIVALREYLHTCGTDAVPSVPVPVAVPVDPGVSAESPLLLIVDDDPQTHQLTQLAAQWHLRTAIAPNLNTARTLIRQNRPDVILLDLMLESGESGITLLEELAAYRSQIPIVVLTRRDRFTDRVAVARLGGRLFLPKPTHPAEVLQAVNQILHKSTDPSARVMAVDDDPSILMVLKALLQPWGLQVTTLDQPMQFWDTLEQTQPDLVILDIEMPEVNGIELCQALRSDPRWSWMPILFLSARTDTETMGRVFEVGADDYVSKPIVAAELVNRILNRLERSRLLRQQAEIDPVSGVANRQRSVQELEKLLELANRNQQPVCLAVLEVDRLRQINATYSHATGEKALRQIGQLLRQKLRPEDVVARWSGAEFVVGMYGLTQTDGVEWLAEILETLRSLPLITAKGEHLSLSFSGGVVQYPVDGSEVQMLYRSADAVLHWAREQGGDRVLPFGWQPQPINSAFTDVALVYPGQEFADSLLQALETRGYHSRWLPSSEEALANLGSEAPHLRATVILVGGMADTAILGLLRQLGPKVFKQSRVLVLFSQAESAAALHKFGTVSYVLMPCSISVVMQSLRNTLGS